MRRKVFGRCGRSKRGKSLRGRKCTPKPLPSAKRQVALRRSAGNAPTLVALREMAVATHVGWRRMPFTAMFDWSWLLLSDSCKHEQPSARLTAACSLSLHIRCMLALGATWDTALAWEYGAAVASEFRAKGANVLLGPSVNVHRVARNGRHVDSANALKLHGASKAIERAYVHGHMVYGPPCSSGMPSI